MTETEKELLTALVEARDFIKSLLDAHPTEALDFLINNGEDVEEELTVIIDKTINNL